MRQQLVAVTLAGGLTLGVAACGSDRPPDVGIPNPASVFCVEQGGKIEIVEGSGGQQGICVLPDGTRIDEWEYFRKNAPPST